MGSNPIPSMLICSAGNFLGSSKLNSSKKASASSCESIKALASPFRILSSFPARKDHLIQPFQA